MPRNDDLSLILAKAKLNGMLPDIHDEELDAIQQYAQVLFSDDAALNATFARVAGPSNGTDDSTWLQAFITANAGGTVRGMPGQTYLITTGNTLKIPSGTTLDMTGCTVKLKAGNGASLVANSDFTGGNTDITLIGGTYDGSYGSNSFAGVADQNQQHIADFRNVTRLKIGGSIRFINGTKYAIRAAQVTDVVCRDIDLNTHSDGVHIQGPATRVRIDNISGSTGDDFVAIGTTDYATYLVGAGGPINDVVIDGLFPTAGLTAMHAFPNTGNNITDIAVKNVYGSVAGNGGAVRLDSAPGNGGTFSRALLENIQPIVTIDNPLVQIYVADDVTVSDVRRKTPGTTELVRVEASSTVGNLTIEGLVDLGARSASAVNIQGTVTDLTVKRVNVNPGANGGAVNISGSASRVSLSDIHMIGVKNGDYVLRLSATATPLVKLSAVQVNNVDYPIKCFSAAEIDLLGVDFTNCTAVLFLDGAAAAPRIKGAGIKATPTYRAIQRNSTGTASLSTSDFPVDLALAELAKTANDRAYNTNAGLSCGVGPVGYTGTAWKHLITGATY